MKLRMLVLLLTLVGVTTPLHGALILSEVCANEVGDDISGEWIEIFNTSSVPINLTGYKIGDEETPGAESLTEALFRFPAGATIPAGGVQIVAVSAKRFFSVYGFNPTYETSNSDNAIPEMLPYAPWDPDGGVINMSNDRDQALLVDGADNVIDAVSWGGSIFAFTPSLEAATTDGQSFERKNVFVDTNTSSDWQFGPNSPDAVQRSTPGVARVPEPPALVLSCILGSCGLGFLRTKGGRPSAGR